MIGHINKIALLFCLLLAPHAALAREVNPEYLEVLPSTLTVQPYFSIEGGYLSVYGSGSMPIEYDSAQYHKIGLSVSWKGLSAGYGMDMQNGPWTKDESRYGKSRCFDFFTHYYGGKWGFDFSLSRNRGFYISNADDLGIVGDDGVYPQYPDMQSLFMSVNVIRVLNPDEFSLDAPFDQNELQLRGAGSWLIIYSAYYGSIWNNGDIIPARIADKYESLRGLSEVDFEGVNVAPGWTHTWVPHRNYFISLLVSLGLGGQRHVMRINAGDSEHYVLAANASGRLALGWAGERLSIGIYSIAETFSTPKQNGSLSTILNQNRLYASWKF